MVGISVVMPVHNAEATLREAVASIRNQTYPHWQLIIVDDGSSDGTVDIIAQLVVDEPRVHCELRPHEGIVAALQAGCEEASGTYIARMDADDRCEPQRFEKQLALMESAPDLALCGTHVTMFGDRLGEGRLLYESWLNDISSPEDVARNIFVECPVAHPAFFMRRDVFWAVGGYQDRGWAEDYDLVMRLWQGGHKIANLPEPLLAWREHGNRLSMADGRYSLAQFRNLKRHYLRQTVLSPGTPFVQWGAGSVGKTWLREWEGDGPVQVVDIHPRKLGNSIHGVEVIAPEDLPPPGTMPILIAVGAPGARDEIRSWLNGRGHQEARDFWFVA